MSYFKRGGSDFRQCRLRRDGLQRLHDHCYLHGAFEYSHGHHSNVGTWWRWWRWWQCCCCCCNHWRRRRRWRSLCRHHHRSCPARFCRLHYHSYGSCRRYGRCRRHRCRRYCRKCGNKRYHLRQFGDGLPRRWRCSRPSECYSCRRRWRCRIRKRGFELNNCDWRHGRLLRRRRHRRRHRRLRFLRRRRRLNRIGQCHYGRRRRRRHESWRYRCIYWRHRLERWWWWWRRR